ncbi:hypothetical protein PSECIP111951_01346 [Pseudoalteromonas holothuriae]|uniref:Uncharacterized protein n=1 Tax=Pseudoalteromonas holothuriae TaxID=2963714 RepID=A0A9W4QQN2_9GAMM|nr:MULTISPECIES: hypothetical protein [unclassified Pseudoalteromonas]CAH9049441.1 hypothetical protein PSECIP111854_00074 [Pseudoalteromonas sp. CIP111854]CAH9055919.1 hypothetical protein PSECIP111951_01346 [Pseudoalteromonas sp. CIP111951]
MTSTAHANPFSYSLDIYHTLGYIHVVAKGCGSKDDIANMYQTIKKTADTTKLNKLLLNVTELTLGYSGSDVLKVLNVIKQLFSHMYIARVVDPADFKSDLIETFAQKHTMNIKSFFNENVAYDWLVNKP